MRIALLTPNFHPRTCGVGDHGLRQAQELARRGHEVRIYSRAPAELHPDGPAIPVTPLPGSTPLATVRAFDRALSPRPELVVLHYTPQMLGASRFGSPGLPWLAARLRRDGVRVIAVLHELAIHFTPRPDLALGSALQQAQLLGMLAACDRLLVTTHSRLDDLQRRAVPLGLVHRVGLYPIGPNASPLPARPPVDRFRVGLFSTLAFGKRFDVILEAFARIAAERADAELVLLGDLGEDRRRRALDEQLRRHPHAARIRVTGKLALPAVAAELARLSVYLFPMNTGANTRSSTLPIALGAGLPVVATRGHETSSWFVDGENVVFAADLDGAAFAAAALRLARDPDLAARVAAGGRRLYERELTWPRAVDRLLARG